MNSVAVLMSTYNGEKYIKEQIDSILNQKGVRVHLYIRDDGSSDNTINILKEYSKKENVEWYNGKNLKSALSFMNLIKKMNNLNYDYYALADQDDFWMEKKLISAIKMLNRHKCNSGKLYISALNIVDEKLNFRCKSKLPSKITFKKEMIKNYATGCTMVFDNTLKNIINNTKTPGITMHDSYIIRIAILNNSYLYVDHNSYINYRQHSRNVLGMPINKRDLWKQRWIHFTNSKCYTSLDAKELLKIENININSSDRKFLLDLCNYKTKFKSKFRLLFTHIFDSDEIINNLLYKIKIIFNKI